MCSKKKKRADVERIQSKALARAQNERACFRVKEARSHARTSHEVSTVSGSHVQKKCSMNAGKKKECSRQVNGICSADLEMYPFSILSWIMCVCNVSDHARSAKHDRMEFEPMTHINCLERSIGYSVLLQSPFSSLATFTLTQCTTGFFTRFDVHHENHINDPYSHHPPFLFGWW